MMTLECTFGCVVAALSHRIIAIFEASLQKLDDCFGLNFSYFLFPLLQALCKRTLNIVEALSVKHSEKIRYYLSKADEAGHESDR